MSSNSDPSAASTTEIRHCAFCLTEISGDAIKKCSKCHKRAYCCRECQALDWSPRTGKDGQGHKNWCGIDCGEEDIDWKVTPVEGKGLGVVALRDLPVTYRIIVEPRVPVTHFGIADLAPLNGTLQEKRKTNCIGYPNRTAGYGFSLKIARINHSCNPNAICTFDESVEVYILFSLREIKEGEEICASYVGNDAVGSDRRLSAKVLRHWGIVCGEDCACKDEEYRKKLNYASGLIRTYREMANKEGAADIMKKLLEVGEELNTTVYKRQALMYGIESALSRRATLPLAMELIAEAYEFEKLIFHPEKGEWVKKYEVLLENPEVVRIAHEETTSA